MTRPARMQMSSEHHACPLLKMDLLHTKMCTKKKIDSTLVFLWGGGLRMTVERDLLERF